MIKIRSQDIKQFPFEEYSKLNRTDLQALASEHYLSVFTSWMLPQMLAHFATWTLQRSGGLVDPMLTARHNVTTPWELGLWRVATQLKRGTLVKLQSSPEYANYSALVPLILAAHKKYNGVPYSHWKIEENCPLVDEALLEAMLWRDDAVYGLGSEEVLKIRTQGLTVKSGPKLGQVQKPTSQWCLRGIRDTPYADVPTLAQTMLAQIWVAHPSLRSEYMILDPYNWDRMPPPLVDTEIFKQAEPAKTSKSSKWAEPNYIPWEA